VRLNRNQKQNRAEERILEENVACPQKNIQSRRSLEEGSYRDRGQIV